ncbi:RNA polymerase sigma factor [Mucilaginibacter polytrichastri]|uniref:RNA polymerase sigma-70 factor n=1 Tax=Mucilaginibacter polytrichastri TaxID=1302689 RepID=A0A1Q6A442_9SPHI|nr:RNA polymerase sigma-70 factor [Mucilaginibacter polytrichastri]OKS88772.1 hypothetical protein RG47T_4250 [Mucilaginibacter polytrichastri]SFT05477.1 RNA polymerase sigma-70 factor, ECF subfamily [Mucilaginibacter polytrichastri]
MAIKSLHDESELLQKVAEGDQRAFRILYDRYYQNIYAFSLHLLKSELLAEEVVQETFLKFWKLGYELNSLINLESYLIAIARNRSLDLLRRNKLEVRADQQRHFDWSESHNDTEESIILNDTRKILKNAIEKLPPQQKLVYELCHQEGLKYEEAAQRLNLSSFTVQSYMKLALKSVRKHIRENTDIAVLLIIFKIF